MRTGGLTPLALSLTATLASACMPPGASSILSTSTSPPQSSSSASSQPTDPADEYVDEVGALAQRRGGVHYRMVARHLIQNESRDELVRIVQRRAPVYDKSRDGHYNLISALHNSLRGHDPDAALYWLARMLDGGEDRLFVARRLVRMAVEDTGLADTRALSQAVATKDTFDFLGSPEGELSLAQATI